MTILLEKETEDEISFDYQDVIEKVVEKTLEMEECPYECEVSISLVDNDAIRDVNREFRELDIPTDVLSFPMAEYKKPADFGIFDGEEGRLYFNPETGELLLGDIMISLERADEQAEEYGHSLEREVAFLVAHSVLHLIGYDHMEDEERLLMEEKQERVLQALGITRE